MSWASVLSKSIESVVGIILRYIITAHSILLQSLASFASVLAQQEAKKQHDTTIGIAVGVSVGITALFALLFLGIFLYKQRTSKRKGVKSNPTQTITSSQAPLRSQPIFPNSLSFSHQNNQTTNSWYRSQLPTIGRNINSGNPNPGPPQASFHYPPPTYAPTTPGGSPLPELY